ncbi:hypothetical protein PIB30_042333, partial [Stylosanthes scabra]|nr:hypothetical protein [Stylosanthes scabra]
MNNVDTWLRTKVTQWLNSGEQGSFGSEHTTDEGGSPLELGGMWVMEGTSDVAATSRIQSGVGEMVVGLGGAEGEVGGRS